MRPIAVVKTSLIVSGVGRRTTRAATVRALSADSPTWTVQKIRGRNQYPRTRNVGNRAAATKKMIFVRTRAPRRSTPPWACRNSIPSRGSSSGERPLPLLRRPFARGFCSTTVNPAPRGPARRALVQDDWGAPGLRAKACELVYRHAPARLVLLAWAGLRRPDRGHRVRLRPDLRGHRRGAGAQATGRGLRADAGGDPRRRISGPDPPPAWPAGGDRPADPSPAVRAVLLLVDQGLAQCLCRRAAPVRHPGPGPVPRRRSGQVFGVSHPRLARPDRARRPRHGLPAVFLCSVGPALALPERVGHAPRCAERRRDGVHRVGGRDGLATTPPAH